MKINGYDVSGFKGYIYDNCHKLYLYEEKDMPEVEKLDYPKKNENINEILEDYIFSCPLRFIERLDLSKCIVDQFAPKVVFEGFTINMKSGDYEGLHIEINGDTVTVTMIGDDGDDDEE